MNVGYAAIDITPTRPMPLSGFVARCDRPFDGVDDPLCVRALAVGSGDSRVVVLAYDLLAIGTELHGEVLRELAGVAEQHAGHTEWILCTTHTHSAPATITLLGCGEPQRDYWDSVLAASRAAAAAALAAVQPARLRWTHVMLPGHNYNRRRVLVDGRVVMAKEPDAPVLRHGPSWDRMLLGRFDDMQGHGIAGVVSWAAHAVTVCGAHVTADFPGELCRRLGEEHGFPFLYLQGACGNLNPVFDEMTRPQMLSNVDALMARMSGVAWPEAAVETSSTLLREPLQLRYGPLPSVESLESMRDGMAVIAERGEGSADVMAVLADILNVKPGQKPERALACHIAASLQRWCNNALAARAAGEPSCTLDTAVWRLGSLVLAFVSAEVFVETAAELQRSFPADAVGVVGYGSPLVGYVPTDEAMREGGYEADYAYRFYNHPASFAAGSEPELCRALAELVRRSCTPEA